MNIDYLYSVINLYLKKENEHSKTNMKIIKKGDNLKFNINMDSSDYNNTTFFFPMDLFDTNMEYILGMYKNNHVVIDEKYEYDQLKDECHYSLVLKNGRKLFLDGFSIEYLTKIRNIIYKDSVSEDELKFKYNDLVNDNYGFQNNLQPSFAGFASFKSILLISIFFLVVLIVSLVYFLQK